MDSTDSLSILLIAILVALSAFFSSTETAFSSINRIRMQNYAEDGNEKAKLVLKIANQYDKALSTILIGNNIVNIASTAVATLFFTKLCGAERGAAVSTVVMTLAVLTFGEILPKNFAKANSEKIAMGVAGILNMLMWLLTPIVAVFVKMSAALNKNVDEQPSVTEQELKYIIETIKEEGVLEEQESELAQSALEFDDIVVQEILTPRVDMAALNVDDTQQHILKIVEEEGYSRMPVYKDTIDNIIGIVRVKDILFRVAHNEPIELEKILRPCTYVHRTMKIAQLLNLLRRNKNYVAIITDDYGGTMGMVTMEDILEELVGDIWDESDEVVDELVQVNENTYEVNGDCNIYDLFKHLHLDERELECSAHTVGGWTMETFERIPHEGESFVWGELRVTVMNIEDQRITKLKVEKLEAEEKSEE